MSDAPVPAEAVEAAARLVCAAPAGPCATCISRAQKLLAAALPFLPQHVSPSAEDVHAALAGACISDAAAERAAERVLALLSSQPTVEQVRRETLAEAEALIRPSIRIESTEDHFDVVTANTALHRAADRIARAAEAVDPRA